MVMTHDQLGNQWSQIRKLFPGRTTVTISQRCKHNGHKGTLSLETRERKGVVTCVVDGDEGDEGDEGDVGDEEVTRILSYTDVTELASVTGSSNCTMPMVTHITWSRSFECTVKMKDTWASSDQLGT